MKKVIYDYMTEDRAKKMVERGKYDKTTPIMPRSSQKDLFGKPFKMYKITTILEEVSQSEIKYYFDESDLKKKYTPAQIDAGMKLFYQKPRTITDEDNYTYYQRTMTWNDVGPKEKEKYIKMATALDEDDDWWP